MALQYLCGWSLERGPFGLIFAHIGWYNDIGGTSLQIQNCPNGRNSLNNADEQDSIVAKQLFSYFQTLPF